MYATVTQMFLQMCNQFSKPIAEPDSDGNGPDKLKELPY